MFFIGCNLKVFFFLCENFVLINGVFGVYDVDLYVLVYEVGWMVVDVLCGKFFLEVGIIEFFLKFMYDFK